MALGLEDAQKLQASRAMFVLLGRLWVTYVLGIGSMQSSPGAQRRLSSMISC